MFPRVRSLALLTAAVAVVALTVWSVGESQRDSINVALERSETVHHMRTALLEQQAALRAYVETRDGSFANAYELGEDQFAASLDEARALALPQHRELLERMVETANDWDGSADSAMDSKGRESAEREDAVSRQALMNKAQNDLDQLERQMEDELDDALVNTSKISAGLVIGISAMFAVGGWFAFGRRARLRALRRRQELEQRERQTNFAHTLQFMDTEDDAHRLVKRHLQASLRPGAEITVLRRNNSADRLEAATEVSPDSPLAVQLVDAQPRSCLAVRLGAGHTGGTPDELLQCDLCGKTEAELTTCTPLLVQGEVIGAVLVEHDEPLSDICGEYVSDTVTQSAPVVANMRNLAIAELRAATDSLTGLANRRSIQDTLRRMVAQAGRSGQPLSAVALDLDHFKSINDRLGHDKGDDVLAAVAQTLSATVRTSDFVGRQGGEEFIVLLPETGLDGARVVAENLRRELERVVIGGVDQSITASFGVAVLPDVAVDADGLLREADRALYVAKDRGRNRVEPARAGSPQIPA